MIKQIRYNNYETHFKTDINWYNEDNRENRIPV